MPTRSNSVPQVDSSSQESALPAFSALCDEALRRCSTEHGLPVTPSGELRLRAWQLCWLVLDAASAPANNLPELADAQAWPAPLIGQLHAAPALPKLNTQTWQELRRARDQQLFGALLPQAPVAAESANTELAAMLAEAFARLGLEQLRAWITESRAAAMTRWVSSGLLAMDALALSDDNTDVGAVELVVFVQGTLQRVHGGVATTDDIAQSDVQEPAAVSDGLVPETKPVSEAAAGAADTIVSAPDHTPQVVTRPYRLPPRAIAVGASVVAAAAALLFALKPSPVAPLPDTTQKARETAPPVTVPVPATRVATPEPAVVEPPPKPVNTPRPSKPPRFRNVAAAERALAAKKIDDAAYAAAIAELEKLRAAKIAKEKVALQSGKLSQRDYQSRVDAINKKLGF